MSTYYEERIRKTKSMIDRWCGRPARLLQLTKSHATLDILVFEDGMTSLAKNLLISCLEPISIRAPTYWDDCDIEIVLSSRADAKIALLDLKADVEIHASAFEVREHVKW